MNGKKAKQVRREMGSKQPMQQNINISRDDLKILKCSNPDCDSTLFIKVFEIGMLSALMNSTGKDQFVHIEKVTCIKCGSQPSKDEPIKK